MIQSSISNQICNLFGKPDIDLFASCINAQLSRYFSWRPDPNAVAIDAFNMQWENIQAYAFPPFSLIPCLLQKIRRHKARLLLIAPIWPTQAWFSVVLRMTTMTPIILPKVCLTLPQKPREKTPTQNTASSGVNVIRDTLRCSGFPEHITNVILQSWRSGTHSQYWTYHQRWLSFCSIGTINPIQPSINDVLEFLYQQYSLGIGYSALNTARFLCMDHNWIFINQNI